MGEVLLCSIRCLKCNESEKNEANNMRTKKQRELMFQGSQGFHFASTLVQLSPRVQAFPFPSPNTESLKAPSGIQKKVSTISSPRNVKKYFFWVFELDNVCCLSNLVLYSCTDLHSVK